MFGSWLRCRSSSRPSSSCTALVYTLGLWIWRHEIALEATSWYAQDDCGQIRLTPADYWNVFVSVPLFQFVLVRWYFRFFLWFWFLFRVSRLRLCLLASHADRAAGLGFLGVSVNAFAASRFLRRRSSLRSPCSRPILPLLLTTFSLNDFATYVLKAIF